MMSSLHVHSLLITMVFMHGSRNVFFRVGPYLTTFFFVDLGVEDPNTVISGPSSTRQRNAI